MGRNALLGLAVALLAALAPALGAAQALPDGLPVRFAEILVGCPAVPTLEAVGGGGRVQLLEGVEIRIPYGVPYRYRHRLPEGTGFAIVTLDVTDGDPQRRGFRATASDSTCADMVLPPLPIGRGMTLTESRGMAPDQAQIRAMLEAVNALRDAFFRKLYEREFSHAMGEGLAPAVAAELPAMLPEGAFQGFVVLRDTPPTLTPVLDIVRERFSSAAGRVAAAPHDVQAGRELANELSMIIDEGACSRLGELEPRELDRLEAFSIRLQRLHEVTVPDGLGLLYENVLPVPAKEVEELGAILETACPEIAPETIAEHVETATALTRNLFGPIMEAIRDARRLVEESFRFTTTEAFPGATTTLQRFGQLDVVNAFFFGREEVRLLATFSFYPAALRYGGEIQPHAASDRFVLTLGYSLATAVTGDAEREGDGDGTVVAIGAGYRLNQFFNIGAGRWLGGGSGGWYASFSGDLGAVPFLRELFARAPNASR